MIIDIITVVIIMGLPDKKRETERLVKSGMATFPQLSSFEFEGRDNRIRKAVRGRKVPYQ